MANDHGGSTPHLDTYIVNQLRHINPTSVVDFGAGEGKYGEIVRSMFQNRCMIIAVEGYKPTADYLCSKKIYDDVENTVIQNWFRKNNKSYDVAIFGDVLEHLKKQEIRIILRKSIKYFQHIIISVPLRNIFQEDIHSNPLEIHRAYIKEHDFDNYFTREKHIVMMDRNYFKMNVWIENYPLNKKKKTLIDLICDIFGWRVIFILKKTLQKYGLYEKLKMYLKQKNELNNIV